jgi:ATP phosphoribosyltransferase regulatory subunit
MGAMVERPGAADESAAVGASALGRAFLAHVTALGYREAEPSILQPAELFLDVSGEDIRRRMFVSVDADGREWALRPEFTIPVCRAHIASGARSGAYGYAGPVFRMRAGESGEFLQAGVESLGRDDREAADAEVLALACETAAKAGLATPLVRLGDVAILQAMLRGLNLPATLARRLMRAVAAGRGRDSLAAIFDAPPTGQGQHAGMVAALQGQDPQAARRFVEDVLSIAGISSVGGRSASDIAGRFLARASEAEQPVSGEARGALEALLAIAGDPDEAALALRDLAASTGVAMGPEIDALEARTGFMASLGLDVAAMRFDAGFARNLDYYTSFIFELHPAGADLASQPRPLAGGGRYDQLLSRLGAPEPVPAVGLSIWLERLAEAARMAGGR